MADPGIRIPTEGRDAAMSTEAYSQRIGVALREAYGERRFAAKLIARIAEGTDRAAKNWMSGVCGPQASSLILLMAREPKVAAAVQDLVERQRALDAARLRRLPVRDARDL